jgi:hypothetical protein
MEAEIGRAAGVIWRYLHQEHGEATLSRLRQGTKLPQPLLFMAVGWLAREGKLIFLQKGQTLRLSLKGL